MSDEDQFCTDFAREHRTLARPLRDRENHAFGLMDRVPAERLLAEPAADIADDILQNREGAQDPVGIPTSIAAAPLQLTQDLALSAELRGEGLEEHIPCWKWQLRLSWIGATDLFGAWPDMTGADLTVFDNHPQRGRPPTIKWRRAESVLVADCYCPRSPMDDGLDDEALVVLENRWETEQTTRPDHLFEEALNHVKGYCDAVNQQVTTWSSKLRQDLVIELERRQRLLRRGRDDRDRVERLLQEWRVEPLQLTIPQPPTVAPRALPNESAVTLPAPLADSSLIDIVRVINRWADAVEKYTAAFRPLEEERISDLLVATLNGAFGRAEREVFIGGGKSDFYVQSSTFGIDGNADIFVGEVKFWDGDQTLVDAVEQSLNNLTQRTQSAVLVVLVRDRESFSNAVHTGEAALLADDRILEPQPEIAGRPSFRAISSLDANTSVRLCVVFIDLTRSEESLPRPKGRGRRSGSQ